jgi:hypothetical protein
MAKDLQFRHYETLHNLLKMYSREPEEVLVLEAVANGMDAKAKKIEIKFTEDKEEYFISIHNNGLPMSKEDFENYHTVSSSFKVKGEGIGFAGVGAKIFLGVNFETEIITITGKKEQLLLVSRMYRNGKNIKYETNLEELILKSLQKIINNANLEHTYGTTYKVRLTAKGYIYLKQNIKRILQYWFNYAIISNMLKITVDGILIEPTKLSTEKFKKTVKYKGQKINCYFYISQEVIPEEERHIVYYVYGKRIKNESVDFSYQIIEDKSKKVYCDADVSLLAEYLTTNKEDFHKNPQVNNVKIKIKKAFFEFLKEKELIIKPANTIENSQAEVNALTKRFDIALQRKDLNPLYPFSKSTLHAILIPNREGKITITENKNIQSENEIIEHITPNCETNTHQPQEEVEFAKDNKGNKTGEYKERKSNGIKIVEMDFERDPREGWIDFKERVIVFNKGHKFSKNFKNNQRLSKYNFIRVIISVLIKNKNEQEPMDALKTFEYFENLLHEVWIND